MEAYFVCLSVGDGFQGGGAPGEAGTTEASEAEYA